jgi:hypothetical protein
MKKRQRLALILLPVICVAIAIAIHSLTPKEPSFEGRTLSEWVWQIRTARSGPEKEHARAITRQLGTNSIPMLLAWIRESPPPAPPFNNYTWELRWEIEYWLTVHHLIENPYSHVGHVITAEWTFSEFDPANKKQMVKIFVEMVQAKSQETNIDWPVANAISVLSELAPESINSLVDLLTNQNNAIVAHAEYVLSGHIGTNVQAAIPSLEANLRNKDSSVRICAVEALDKIGGPSEKFVPVFIRALPEIKPDYLDWTLDFLVRHKELARPAIPELVNILKHTPPDTAGTTNRAQLVDTIHAIAPEMDINAAVK